MSKDTRFDISVKNMQGKHQLSVGYFPPEFTGNNKTVVMEVKDNDVLAKEETPKVKRVIKLGKIVTENIGTVVNNYKGNKLGGQNGKYVLFNYEDK